MANEYLNDLENLRRAERFYLDPPIECEIEWKECEGCPEFIENLTENLCDCSVCLDCARKMPEGRELKMCSYHLNEYKDVFEDDE